MSFNQQLAHERLAWQANDKSGHGHNWTVPCTVGEPGRVHVQGDWFTKRIINCFSHLFVTDSVPGPAAPVISDERRRAAPDSGHDGREFIKHLASTLSNIPP